MKMNFFRKISTRFGSVNYRIGNLNKWTRIGDGHEECSSLYPTCRKYHAVITKMSDNKYNYNFIEGNKSRSRFGVATTLPQVTPHRSLSDSHQSVDRNIREDPDAVSKLNPADVIEFSDEATRKTLVKDMIIYNDFLSAEEESSLLSEIEPYMKKLRYEYDHWDGAIHGYRETEKRHWNEENQAIIQRVRDLAFPPDIPEAQLAFVHILDLEEKGFIKPHIDSVRFCGSTITGLSLLSDSVMKLVHEENQDSWSSILLKRRSLYIMRGAARYQYKHEVLGDKQSFYKNQHIPRHRRISVICRNEAADLTGFDEPSDDKDTKRTY